MCMEVLPMKHFEYPVRHVIQDALIVLSPVLLTLIGALLLV